MGMTMEAQEARKKYQREYRDRNRDRINAIKRAWSSRNPDKLRQYQQRYWRKKALKKRASWEDLGIGEQRRKELERIARSDEYIPLVMWAAVKADRLAAGHIFLSVTKNIAYEKIEFHERLGRCPLGKTDFYGARRWFYYYLDEALEGKSGK